MTSPTDRPAHCVQKKKVERLLGREETTATSTGYCVRQKSVQKKDSGDGMIAEEQTKEMCAHLYMPDCFTKPATNLGFPG